MYNHIVREADYKLWSIEKEIFVSCYELIFVVGGIKASDGCTTQGWVKVNKEYKADTPIIDAVYEILYENKDAKAVFKELTDKLN